MTLPAASTYQQAIDLYRGDYLAGGPTGDWHLEQRELLRDRYLNALDQLAALSASLGDYGRSIDICRRVLALDPIRENVWQNLIRSLWQSGQRTEALRTYERCRRMLQRELNIEPLPETRALRDAIRSSST